MVTAPSSAVPRASVVCRLVTSSPAGQVVRGSGGPGSLSCGVQAQDYCMTTLWHLYGSQARQGSMHDAGICMCRQCKGVPFMWAAWCSSCRSPAH